MSFVERPLDGTSGASTGVDVNRSGSDISAAVKNDVDKATTDGTTIKFVDRFVAALAGAQNGVD